MGDPSAPALAPFFRAPPTQEPLVPPGLNNGNTYARLYGQKAPQIDPTKGDPGLLNKGTVWTALLTALAVLLKKIHDNSIMGAPSSDGAYHITRQQGQDLAAQGVDLSQYNIHYTDDEIEQARINELRNMAQQQGVALPPGITADDLNEFYHNNHLYGLQQALTLLSNKLAARQPKTADGGKFVGVENPNCGLQDTYEALTKKNKDAKRTNPKVFPQEAHHMPSFAAMKLEAEEKFNDGNELDDDQEERLKNALPALDVPTDVHRDTRSYGGRQNSKNSDGETTIEQDAKNPRQALENDVDDIYNLEFPPEQSKCRKTTEDSLKDMLKKLTAEEIDKIKNEAVNPTNTLK